MVNEYTQWDATVFSMFYFLKKKKKIKCKYGNIDFIKLGVDGY